jgi:hypothetical protein
MDSYRKSPLQKISDFRFDADSCWECFGVLEGTRVAAAWGNLEAHPRPYLVRKPHPHPKIPTTVEGDPIVDRLTLVGLEVHTVEVFTRT